MSERNRPTAPGVLSSGAVPAALTVEDALLSRRSVRAFLPTPVPRTEVVRLLELASRSASNSNCQPWHVHVLTGRAKSRLTRAIWRQYDAGSGATQREYSYQPAPDEWQEPFRTRRARFGETLYRDTLGCDPSDLSGRARHHRRNYDFFGAPVGIILTVSRHPMASALVDAGLFLQALMLAARQAGLDTCPQAAFIDFSAVIRENLTIPDDHVIVTGLALGHADADHELNRMRTPREPVEHFTTFYGD
ncbi:Nitroreductase [Pseudonocardia thermophila]|jgi:Nitroreductase|uniref:Nitroreductase n=1 Tax=Pseudonocardia thermophila TaxID=1848 RepID=A0A1M6XIL8_PSETH|nr:nitroreductase [Pseudonocardia thermophila]SHL05748.1 Nitroreductase [Pseudonocardia thermophila]